MSDKAHSGPREDAAEKRLEYVWKKTGTFAFALVTGSIAVVCVLLAAFALRSVAPKASLAWFIILVTFGGLAFVTARQCKASLKESLSLPYVPPVAEQLANLPADEVLLRGSDQPAATSGELLRALHSATETAPKELLRPTENGTT